MQGNYIFIVMYHFQGQRNKGEKGAMAPTFYNFFTGVGFCHKINPVKPL